MVVEADESDRSFLALSPEVAVVTNVELDHHTTYASELELERGVRGVPRAAARGRHGGRAGTGAGCARRRPAHGRHVRPRGRRRRSARATFEPAGRRRALRARCGTGEPVGEVELPVPGEHNVLNALAALGGRARPRAATSRTRRAALASFQPGRPALRAAWASATARACSTTTPIIRPRSRPRCGPRARSSRGG